MTRLIVIAIFAVLAYLLLKYRTNVTLQKWVAIVLSAALLIYISFVVVTELIR
ncbi:hypothetical protein ACGRL8_06350 [Vibrio rumoiensis]|uniref:Uncharacterized protein n=1 Tax=Vibrio rumoiensis TaxID=76258 RepID=A0ABW7ITY5_9VIBR|nr:hypothetical protein [Vibrio rumoiensis]